MGHKQLFRTWFLVLAGAWGSMAWADLYSANAVAEKGDFARAFPLYRELAKLGHAQAQDQARLQAYEQGRVLDQELVSF